MWIHRQTACIKPGLMDLAVAHVNSQPLREGITRRILRPITGPESTSQLVIERSSSGDVDAAYGAWMTPQPSDEPLKAWMALSENRGAHELLSVVHELPAMGRPGAWVDRRLLLAAPGHRADGIALWKGLGRIEVEGFCYRLLTPRTGVEAISTFVAEWTFQRLEAWDAALASYMATPEAALIATRWNQINPFRSTWELYRVIG